MGELRIDQIRIGERHRKELHDIEGLARNIAEVGLLHPIVVTPDGELIAGQRRLAAIRKLGWAEVPVRVVDLEETIIGEYAENVYREDFTPTEAVAIGRALEERVKTPPGRPTEETVENFHRLEHGKTRDKVGAVVGMSGRTYEKARQVVEAAEQEPEAFGDLPELMDDNSIHGAYKEMQKRKLKRERKQRAENVIDKATLQGKYRALIIDPPWPTQKILRDVRPNQDTFDYPTMTLGEIARLPVADLAYEDGCHVYLWTTHKFLPDALHLFEGWGVKYQCLLTWHKNVGPTPFSWMYDTEHVLFGRIGNLKLLEMGLRLGFEAKAVGHSIKPDVFYERVKRASPEPRLELFARQRREGFVVWGNEAPDGL